MDKRINRLFLAFTTLIVLLVMMSSMTDTNDAFSEQMLKNEAEYLEIHHIDIVLAQARLETGNFKSNLFKNNRNLFGWKINGKYKKYETWRKSLLDYKLFQHKYYKPGEDYFKFLTRTRFCEADSVYKKRILSCIK